jgi:hypothetical protein
MPSSTSSDHLTTNYLNFLLKGIRTWTPPTTLYVALFKTIPALDGTGGTEVSTGSTGYARKSITSAQWSGPASGTSLEYNNSVDIEFDEPTADWGTILGCGLYDAATGGNLYYIATLSAGKAVVVGDGAPRILVGQLRITRASC